MFRNTVALGLAAILCLPAVAADNVHLTVDASKPRAKTLTGTAVDSINTFETPNGVVPNSTPVKVHNGSISLTVRPSSVTVISIEQ